ncbi:SET domain-containing protein 9 [Lingula anatina]|uniref:SET domain-containing protein 9 n=1 Tax=Lingula anatina TaxID=7574 RepID=A0A1S3H176_LINAN|nr:SET domain-containing protein 9 [Lingula anatina]|eukprot:XP_013379890.1 SET domain-containing protein 9 [Lingula anatina]
MLKKLATMWHQYKYRFVPWIAVNLRNRKLRSVPKGLSDKVITDEVLQECIVRFFTALNSVNECNRLSDINQQILETGKHYSDNMRMNDLSKESNCNKNDNLLLTKFESIVKNEENVDITVLYKRNLKIMKTVLGFSIERTASYLKDGGYGVQVTDGTVPKGAVVALYPGTIYEPFEPIFFQSLHNQFIFRCIDGVYIDGNDRGISKMIYRSSAFRDRLSLESTYDLTWLTQYLVNPMAVGQYVNNQSNEYPANVAYQEFEITNSFPHSLRKYLPNVHYSPYSMESHMSERNLRVVALISLREIQKGEELFSSYFTVVHS